MSKYNMNEVCHYKYLEKHLNAFWIKVVGKSLEEDFCAGIISANGDKVYSYQETWEEQGVPFPHGVAIFLLTYKSSFFDRDGEQKAHDWVSSNYQKYKEYLVPIDLDDDSIVHFLNRK